MNPAMLGMLAIIIIPIGIFIFMKKRKKNKEEGNTTTNRLSKKNDENGESWRTVKEFLKSNKEVGKEIIELFVAKRKDPDDVSAMTKAEKKEYKKKRKEKKILKSEDIEEFKRQKKNKKRIEKSGKSEVWVLLFITRNTKTNVLDKPRIIEAVVKYVPVSKKKTERKVYVTGEMNYKKEMKWLSPIKDKEDKQVEKQRKINDKQKIKNKNKKKSSKKNIILNKIKNIKIGNKNGNKE